MTINRTKRPSPSTRMSSSGRLLLVEALEPRRMLSVAPFGLAVSDSSLAEFGELNEGNQRTVEIGSFRPGNWGAADGAKGVAERIDQIAPFIAQARQDQIEKLDAARQDVSAGGDRFLVSRAHRPPMFDGIASRDRSPIAAPFRPSEPLNVHASWLTQSSNSQPRGFAEGPSPWPTPRHKQPALLSVGVDSRVLNTPLGDDLTPPAGDRRHRMAHEPISESWRTRSRG